jgi:hypothetical protein
MYFSARSKAILKQLHECGQVASIEQLKYNEHDNGCYCTRLTVCLNRLVKHGYISVTKVPIDWDIKTTSARNLYILGKRGAEYLDVPFYDLVTSRQLMKTHFMLSEVFRQFNAAGYALTGGFFHDGVYGFQLKSKSFSVFCFWDDSLAKDFAKEHLKYFIKRRFNPEEAMLVFFLDDRQKYLDWKAYTQSAEFNRLCPYEASVYMPQLPLCLLSAGEPISFRGWGTLSRVEA